MIAKFKTKRFGVTEAKKGAGMLFTKLSTIAFIVIGIFSASVEASAQNTASAGNLSGQVVAEVGAHRITRGALETELHRHINSHLDAYSPDEQHLLRQRMLEMMIKRTLLIDAANRSGSTPNSAELTEVVEQFRQEVGGEEELTRELAERNLDKSTFIAGLRDDLAINTYLRETVFRHITVSKEEAERFFEKNPEKFIAPEEVRVRHILFRLSEDTDPAERERVEVLARRVLELLRSGTDFATLAERYSEAPNGAKGGELDFFTANQMDPAFSEAAFALKRGEISDIVKTRHGLHIIKMEERRGGENKEFSEVEDEVRQWIQQEKQSLMLSRHLEQLRESNKVIVYYR